MKRMIMGRIVFPLLSLLLLLLTVFSVGADVGRDYSDADRSSYMSLLYNSQNGMPTSEANDILQGEDGFIWIACYSGLVRYDGVRFERLTSYGLTSICGLYYDSQERLWAATNDHGVILRVSDGVFKTYTKADGLRSASVRAITEYADGSILFGTTDGLHRLTPEGEMLAVGSDRLYCPSMGALCACGGNRAVGVTSGGDIFMVQDNDETLFIPYKNSKARPTCVSIDENGEYWFGTEDSKILKGTLSEQGVSCTAIDTGSLSHINRILFIGERAWFCADNGIGYIEDGTCFPVESAMNNSIDSLCVDNEGNLWFASSRQGVMQFTENSFRDVTASLGLDSMVTNASLLTEKYLYIGTDEGLFIADRRDPDYTTVVENELTARLRGVRVRSAMEDARGNVWLSTYGGLFCESPDGTVSSFTTDDGLPTDKVRLTVELHDGRYAVGTSEGLCFIEDGRVSHIYNKADGLGNADILSICEGEDGLLLVGTDGGGAYTFKNGVFGMPFTGDNGLTSEVVMRIKYDRTYGGYWLVTGSDLEFFDGEIIHRLEYFPYFNNYDLYFKDDSPTMWVLGSGGIYIVDREALLSGGPVNYICYRHADGLLSDLTANSYACLGDDDNLYLCSSTGTLMIDWNSPGHSRVPRITVPCVYADGEYIPVKGGCAEIPAKTERLVIECYALTYTLQDPMLSYELEGFDSEPTQVLRSELGEVRFNYVPGGEYTFSLAVVDPISGQVITSRHVAIIKPKTFRETAWFYVLIVLGMAVLIAGVFAVIAVRRIREANRRSEASRHLTNEIISTFSHVIDAKDKYTNGHSHRVAAYSQKIAKALGFPEERVQEIYNIALLHDIGKLGIPDGILNKNGPLNDEEYAMMKTHTRMGADILADIDVLPEIGLGAKYHHERYDGRGYMEGLSGEDIPEICRIIAVADSFDAMNSTRVYRKTMSEDRIISELQKGSGSQFDPRIVSVLLKMIENGEIKMNEPEEHHESE